MVRGVLCVSLQSAWKFHEMRSGFSSKGPFDCVAASRSEAATPLGMTNGKLAHMADFVTGKA
jgi:hypothetical protein